jgi:uncharacterized damage-inducible protein DinB
MSFRNETQRIIAYHSWSRAKYLDLYDRLPWEVLTRDRGSTFGSIRNVHLHILGVYAWWLVKLFGRRSLKRLWDALDEKNYDRVTSAQQLRELDRKVDRELLEVGRTLTEVRLRRKHQLTIGSGRRVTCTEREGVWHVLEEDYLHRGEILCMLWQDNIEPPYTGYVWWEYDTDPKSFPYLAARFRKLKPSEGGYVKHPPGSKSG